MLVLLCFSYILLLCSVVFQFQINEIQVLVSKKKSELMELKEKEVKEEEKKEIRRGFPFKSL